MGTFYGLDYWKLAPHMDIISWDNYPMWHASAEGAASRKATDRDHQDWRLASDIAFVHDINRSLKQGKPFMLMESCPSATNWQPVGKLKRPGVHLLASLQAVAHGSDTVQYFQWRKSRGSSEKFHGAVVDHEGSENTRVFNEVVKVGEALEKIKPVLNSRVPARAAVIFDWENRWALDDAEGPRNDGRKAYEETVKAHYHQLWRRGINADVIDMDQPVDAYDLLIAPMLYMVKPGVKERLESFVEKGGTLVCTYMTGWVDETDLCFLGGFPGPLRKLLGIWAEELDCLYPGTSNSAVFSGGNSLGIQGSFELEDFCELVHSEGAEVLATFGEEFFF